MDFPSSSHARHEKHFDAFAKGAPGEEKAKKWLDTDSVDAWRHHRMFDSLLPVLDNDKAASWVTIGDGRYGKDAIYLNSKGARTLATDIADTLLKEAKALGLLEDFRKENAESLSFPDNTFDYALCKESYHHFPRPYLAAYEMLRVAKKGIFLIEPADDRIGFTPLSTLFRWAKHLAKKLMGRKGNSLYEDSGNYIYRISKREIEKIALGLDYPVVIFKQLNDAYVPGAENEKLEEKGPYWKKIRSLISIGDFFTRLGLLTPTLLVAGIFKTAPQQKMAQALQTAGFQIVHLPRNPHGTSEEE